MEGLFQITGQMVTLFAIIAVGFVAKKIGFLTADFDKMFSKVVLNIAIPGMIVGSVLDAEELPTLENILLAFGISCVCYLLIIILAYIVTFALRLPKGFRGVFKFMLCFGNVGFIGFPVLSTIFGSEVLIYAAIFNLPFNVLVFTVGILFITQDSEAERENTGDLAAGFEAAGANASAEAKAKPSFSWRILLTPAIVSCAVAIVLAVLRIHNVPIIGETFSTLGSLTTPGALLIIGSSLAGIPRENLIGGPKLWFVALFRLFALPLCVWAVFHFFVTDPLLLGGIVIISGMPVATNGTMLCYQYGGNSKVMAQGTFVTTVLSLVSIPLLVQFLGVVF